MKTRSNSCIIFSICLLPTLVASSAGASVVTVTPTVGNPVASGNALVAAVNAITGNSWGDRSLVRLEPGVYDIGTQTLVMKPWVDIEGSGVETTFLYGKGHDYDTLGIYAGLVHGASNAELRDMTIRVYPDTSLTGIVTIFADGESPRLSNLRLQAFGTDADFCAGFVGRGSEPEMFRVQINAVCNKKARGFVFESPSAEVRPKLEDVVVNIRSEGSGSSAMGITFKEAAFPGALRRSRIVSSSAGSAWGVRGLGISGATLSSDLRFEVLHDEINVSSDVGSATSLELPTSYSTRTLEAFSTSIAGGSAVGNVNCYAIRDVDAAAFLPNTCP